MFQSFKVAARLTNQLKNVGSKRYIILTPKSFKQHRKDDRTIRSMQEPDAKDFSGMGYILLVIPVAAFGLGTWQVYRRQWKLSLIADLEKRTMADPIPFPTNLEALQELEYRKVVVNGTFDHNRELYMMPRSPIESQSQGFRNPGKTLTGAHVVTVFRLADSGLEILVNRGWVPKDKIKPETRQEGQIGGQVEFTAVVRHTEKRPQFAAKNDVVRNQWYNRDVDAMAATLGAAPVFVDADRKSTVDGGPIGGQTRVTLRNEHLSYIITWYSLSLLTFLMWFKAYWRRA